MNKRLLQYVLRRRDNWPLNTVCKTVRTRSCYALLRTDNCPVNIFSDTVRTRCFYVLRRTDNCQNIYTVILLEQEAAMFSVEQTTALYLQGWEFAQSLICSSLICSFVQVLRSLRSNEQLWAICSDCSGQMSDCEQITQVTHDKWATVSDWLRLLMINEQMSKTIVLLSESLICSVAHKKQVINSKK